MDPVEALSGGRVAIAYRLACANTVAVAMPGGRKFEYAAGMLEEP